jgi:hypothetical protein
MWLAWLHHERRDPERMSEHQVLATIDALLKDAGVGLKAKVDALVILLGPATTIRSDFNFVKWALRGRANPSQAPNVMLAPRRWTPDQKLPNKPQRDAWCEIEIGLETFGTDPAQIQDEVTIWATALAQCIDGLRAFSDANGGTVVDVDDPLSFQFGEFTGPASSGFLARVTVLERSSL